MGSEVCDPSLTTPCELFTVRTVFGAFGGWAWLRRTRKVAREEVVTEAVCVG